MGTLKTIIGMSVVTGVVVYVFLRSMNGQINHKLAGPEKQIPQLV